MVTALQAFKECRIVSEGASPGTKIDTATQRLLGVVTAPMGGVVLHRPLDERGSLFQNRRTVIVGEDLPITFEGDVLTDQLTYFGQMGVRAITNPLSDPQYVWHFKPDANGISVPSILSYTFQFGNNLAVYDISYVTCRQLQISGAMGEPCKVRAELFGRDFEVGTFNPAIGNTGIDPDSTETCLTNKTQLYIDAVGGTWGNTLKAATLLGFTWTLDTGFRPVKHGSGNIYFDAIVQHLPKITCEITAEFNTITEAERVLYQAGTARLFNLKMGSVGGTDYVYLYWSGIYTSWEPISEEDGLAVVRFTCESQFDSAANTLFNMVIRNSIATMV